MGSRTPSLPHVFHVPWRRVAPGMRNSLAHCPEKQNRRSRPLSGAGQHETNTAAQAVVIKPVIGPEQ